MHYDTFASSTFKGVGKKVKARQGEILRSAERAIDHDRDKVAGLHALCGEARTSAAMNASNFFLARKLIARLASGFTAGLSESDRVALVQLEFPSFATHLDKPFRDAAAIKKMVATPLKKAASGGAMSVNSTFVRSSTDGRWMIQPRVSAVVYGKGVEALLGGQYGALNNVVRPTEECLRPITAQPVDATSAGAAAAVATLLVPPRPAECGEPPRGQIGDDDRDTAFNGICTAEEYLELELLALAFLAVTPLKKAVGGFGGLKLLTTNITSEVAKIAVTRSARENAKILPGGEQQFIAGLSMTVGGNRVGLPWHRC